MSLADLATRTANPEHKQCGTCWLLTVLDPPTRDHLLTALANPAVRYGEISDALAAEGHDIPSLTLSRHARGQCSARTKLRGVA